MKRRDFITLLGGADTLLGAALIGNRLESLALDKSHSGSRGHNTVQN